MKPDYLIDPPAEVRPAEDLGDLIRDDRINTLLAEAQQFGRKTVEQAVECGRRLLAARAEVEKSNAGVKVRAKKIVWTDVLERYGFSKETARRLMIKAASHNSRPKMGRELDEIYDDGYDPAEDAGKIPCRDCRIQGKKFSRSCRKCKARNRPVPKPKEDKPLTDNDGKPVPESLIDVWNDAQTIRHFNKQLLDFGKAIDGLLERPGCAGVPADHFRAKLKALANTLWAYRPGYVCPECNGAKCVACEDRGWFPDVTVRQRRAEVKKAERRDQWKRRQQPIPE